MVCLAFRRMPFSPIVNSPNVISPKDTSPNVIPPNVNASNRSATSLVFLAVPFGEMKSGELTFSEVTFGEVPFSEILFGEFYKAKWHSTHRQDTLQFMGTPVEEAIVNNKLEVANLFCLAFYRNQICNVHVVYIINIEINRRTQLQDHVQCCSHPVMGSYASSQPRYFGSRWWLWK